MKLLFPDNVEIVMKNIYFYSNRFTVPIAIFERFCEEAKCPTLDNLNNKSEITFFYVPFNSFK